MNAIMKKNNEYSAPRLKAVCITLNRVIAQSVGGDTGYSGGGVIGGGTLTDDDD